MADFKIDDYLEGVRNFYSFLDVRKGEQVLLLPTFEFMDSDPLALDALRQVAKEIGAEVSVALIEGWSTRGNPPKPIVRAMEGSNLFMAMGDRTPNPITGHCLSALTARWDYGSKQTDLHGGKGILATECSRFPIEVFLAIGRALMERLKGGKKIEITDEKGTHLSFPYDPQDLYGASNRAGGRAGPGERVTWPLGNITILPGESFSGVAMVDCIRGTPKIMQPPARIVIENSWAVEIVDREETRKIKAEFAKPENSNFVDKLLIGLNPKGSKAQGLHRSRFGELCQAAGVTQLGIGDRPGYVASHFYTCAFLLEPTILLDGKVLFDRGRPVVFDDPGVKEIAGRYGDPEQVLARIP